MLAIVEMGELVVPADVLTDPEQITDLDIEAGLLAHFAHHGVGEGLTRSLPAAGKQEPITVGILR